MQFATHKTNSSPINLAHLDIPGLDVAQMDVELIARHARTLRLPAGRWLMRPGRKLAGRYYLVEGRVWLEERSARILSHRSRRARKALNNHPQARCKTLSEVHLLHLDWDALSAEQPTPALGHELQTVHGDEWLYRFLEHPLIHQLDNLAWQKLLGAFSYQSVAKERCLLRAGESPQQFTVLCHGTACSSSGVQYQPGDLIGAAELAGNCALPFAVSVSASSQVALLSRHRALRLLFMPLFQTWMTHPQSLPLFIDGSLAGLSREDSVKALQTWVEQADALGLSGYQLHGRCSQLCRWAAVELACAGVRVGL